MRRAPRGERGPRAPRCRRGTPRQARAPGASPHPATVTLVGRPRCAAAVAGPAPRVRPASCR
ncbi:hypothetical protein ACFFX0_11775 [Citricoccus parietis]|uniref:Uncharacterized protein n=1 Tax=Citricoccus parietis TaxID=592307 RepID=A0ABV5FYU3_9MICC